MHGPRWQATRCTTEALLTSRAHSLPGARRVLPPLGRRGHRGPLRPAPEALCPSRPWGCDQAARSCRAASALRPRRFPVSTRSSSRPVHRGCGCARCLRGRGRGRVPPHVPQLPDCVRAVTCAKGHPETARGSPFPLNLTFILQFSPSSETLLLGPAACPA